MADDDDAPEGEVFEQEIEIDEDAPADLDEDIGQWAESAKLRTDIGLAAKKVGWFKDTTRGDQWFKTLVPAFADPEFPKKDIAVKLAKLWTWAENV